MTFSHDLTKAIHRKILEESFWRMVLAELQQFSIYSQLGSPGKMLKSRFIEISSSVSCFSDNCWRQTARAFVVLMNRVAYELHAIYWKYSTITKLIVCFVGPGVPGLNTFVELKH